MTRKDGLPRRVYLRHGAYFFVRPADGKWLRLSAEKDGLPAMLRALAGLVDTEQASDTMPAVITRWLAAKRPEWSDKTATDQDRIAAEMSAAFAKGTPRQVTTPIAAEYLRRYVSTPRTYNLHRSMLRQVLAFAALEGLREGWNPVDNIPQKQLKGRKRWVTDEDVKLLKAAARSLPATLPPPARRSRLLRDSGKPAGHYGVMVIVHVRTAEPGTVCASAPSGANRNSPTAARKISVRRKNGVRSAIMLHRLPR